MCSPRFILRSLLWCPCRWATSGAASRATPRPRPQLREEVLSIAYSSATRTKTRTRGYTSTGKNALLFDIGHPPRHGPALANFPQTTKSVTDLFSELMIRTDSARVVRHHSDQKMVFKARPVATGHLTGAKVPPASLPPQEDPIAVVDRMIKLKAGWRGIYDVLIERRQFCRQHRDAQFDEPLKKAALSLPSDPSKQRLVTRTIHRDASILESLCSSLAFSGAQLQKKTIQPPKPFPFSFVWGRDLRMSPCRRRTTLAGV